MAIFPQGQSLHTLRQVIDGVDVGLGQPRQWMWAWGGGSAGQTWLLGPAFLRQGVEPTPL